MLLNRIRHGAGCADVTTLSEEEAHRCAKEFVAVFNMVSAQHARPTCH
jgi:hypothetical protein